MAWAEKRGQKWVGRYRDSTGSKRSTHRCVTKTEALRLVYRAEAEVSSEGAIESSLATIDFRTYYSVHWLPNRIISKNRRATIQSHFRTSLEPAFGDIEVRAIRRTDVQAWVADEMARGATGRTLRDKVSVLQTILGATSGASAIRDGLIEESPVEGVNLPTLARRGVDFYEPGEFMTLLTHMSPYELVALLAVETGFRWGELAGLRVDDLSANFQRVWVKRALIELPKTQTATGTRFEEKATTKNGQDRCVLVREHVAEAIRKHVDRYGLRSTDRLLARVESTPASVVRTHEWPGGLPISRAFFRQRVWYPAHEKAALRRRRFHDLRASHITWLLSGGADVATVQRRVGHATLVATQRYVAAMQDADRRALAALDRVLPVTPSVGADASGLDPSWR